MTTSCKHGKWRSTQKGCRRCWEELHPNLQADNARLRSLLERLFDSYAHEAMSNAQQSLAVEIRRALGRRT